MGRFISPDTITPDMTQRLNRYSYVNNRPINFNDPTGHDPWWNDPTFYVADYIEAGIWQQSACQCDSKAYIYQATIIAGGAIVGPIIASQFIHTGYYDSAGPAKVSQAQLNAEYGTEVCNPGSECELKGSGDGDRGMGLGLYGQDPHDMDVARTAMARRIAFFLAKVCLTNCSREDTVMVAALAANGDLTATNYKPLKNALQGDDFIDSETGEFDWDSWLDDNYGDHQRNHIKNVTINAFKIGLRIY